MAVGLSGKNQKPNSHEEDTTYVAQMKGRMEGGTRRMNLIAYACNLEARNDLGIVNSKTLDIVYV